MKTCARCGKAKADTEYNKSARNSDGLHSYCRQCQKEHYKANSTQHMANVRRTSAERSRRMRQVIFEAMSGGCVDCGNTDIRVLEFDHVRGTKVEGIGQIVRKGLSMATLRTELLKCDVRCRNCHVIATFTRLGKSWHDEYMNA